MKKTKPLQHNLLWDRLGIFASLICLVHCLILPLAVVFSPRALSFGAIDGLWHDLLLVVVFLLAATSFISSYKTHGDFRPLILGTMGLLVLALSEILNATSEELWHWVLAGFGTLCLVGAHFWNIKICHCFCSSHCSHESHKISPPTS